MLPPNQPPSCPPAPSLPQAVELPGELALLQGLRSLRLEYAHLDALPAAVQASACKG